MTWLSLPWLSLKLMAMLPGPGDVTPVAMLSDLGFESLAPREGFCFCNFLLLGAFTLGVVVGREACCFTLTRTLSGGD